MPKKPALDLAALGAQYGISIDATVIKPIAELRAEEKARSQSDLEAGTLLLQTLHEVHRAAMLSCKKCHRGFMSNYCSDWYCSRECMVKEFEEHFGVPWDSLTPPEDYYPKEPSRRIPPVITEALYDWCKSYIELYETTDQYPPEDSQEFSIVQESEADQALVVVPDATTLHTPPVQTLSDDYEEEATFQELLEDPEDPFAGLEF